MEKLFKAFIIAIVLASIIYIAIWVRLETLDSKMVLNYDPWWFYRYAKDISENNFKLPKWDYLSYYPPGRPVTIFSGWSYTIALLSKLLNLDLITTAKISPLIMVASSGIVAYILAYKITNNWIASFFAPIFVLLSPPFLSVSVAGYNDTDAPVVFYFLLSVLFSLLAIEKKKIHFYVLAVLANLLFILNWGGGWITLILFFLLIPFLVVYRLIEEYIITRKINLLEITKNNLAPTILPFFIIFLATNIIGQLIGLNNMFVSFFGGLAFAALSSYIISFVVAFSMFLVVFFSLFAITSKHKISIVGGFVSFVFIVFLLHYYNIPTKPLIVNISVAELQPLTTIREIMGRVEAYQVLLTFSLIPLVILATILGRMSRVEAYQVLLTFSLIPLVITKLLMKKRSSYLEIFLILWSIFMIVLITRGVRFSLLFLISSSIASTYVISNILNYLSKRTFAYIVVLSFFSLLAFNTINYSIGFRFASRGMEISDNWFEMLDWLKNNADKDALIA
ncbi:MAG: STT3 domain-containing protein, partial [Candidatus Aenigmarchaeota archaeon]|nr:hypothetical protein [Candidatus Aenigmarchaeota archaeon]MDW8149686.1 STT3 domain-containing protein [Candidatus Aenigmarchaeota archaeon]